MSGYVLLPGEGRVAYLVEDRHSVKLSASQGAGRMGISEVTLEPGVGVPPRRHGGEDEFFYVLEGQVTFVVGDEAITAEVGEHVFARRGVVHCFANNSDRLARLVLAVSPGRGFEKFWQECGVKCAGEARPSRAMVEEAVGRIIASASSFGIQMLPEHVPARTGKVQSSARQCNVLGDPVKIYVGGTETDGAFGVAEVTAMPGGGPPPHVHPRGDEAFYILEGEVDVLAGSQWKTLTAGTFAYSGPGELHTYRGGKAGARFLVFFTPAGFEKMFLELGMIAMPPQVDKVREICGRWDTHFEPA